MKKLIFVLDPQFKLAHAIAAEFAMPLHAVCVDRFADSEVQIRLPKGVNLSGTTVFVVHSTCPPVHDNLMKLWLLIHALKRHGVSRVVAVVPYFGYGRQIETGGAQLVAQLFQAAGADSIVTVDPHDPKLVDLFSIPLYAVHVEHNIIESIKKNIPDFQRSCIIAPDEGAHERAQTIATALNVPLVRFKKERCDIDTVCLVGVEGECFADTAIIVDDIIDTGSTALRACEQLQQRGIKTMYGYFVHPVFSGDAVHRLQQGLFKKLFVAETITIPESARGWLETFKIAQDVVEVLKREIDGKKS